MSGAEREVEAIHRHLGGVVVVVVVVCGCVGGGRVGVRGLWRCLVWCGVVWRGT